ncbi:MAG: thioredoxin domain-containing protein, partial [Candidatus Limnocylindrales bacterium]
VMERETFEDEAVAADLRRDFIAIKVDREERPDLDAVYMAAVQTMTGGGGWPMSVFLTPAGRPFYGGTYFPPEPRHGLPAFRQVLAGVATAWRDRRAELEASGARLVEAIVESRAAVGADPGLELNGGVLDAAVAALETTFDAGRGGWGGAPKFPSAMTIAFLLRRSVGPNGRTGGDPRALAMARRTLDAMAGGGIHDQLGGGFHRYATDAGWLVPHFEQMLYDNALLADAYLDAWRLTGEPAYRDVAFEVLDFIARDLRRPDGTFAASLDADTLGVEGATFTWTAPEIRALLGDEAALLAAAYGVTDGGNWEGRTILSRVRDDAELAERFGPPVAEIAERLSAARAILFARRSERPQPARDDKALTAWNGLAIGAFARAAAAIAAGDSAAIAVGDSAAVAGDAGRAIRYRDLAATAATALLAGVRDSAGRVHRSWKDGRATADGVLEDHADLAAGLLALYEATFDERWFAAARELADAILERFVDPDGGFFDTAADAETLITRPKEPQDNAVPSGGAMATTVLLRLAALTGDDRYRDAADSALRGVVAVAPRHPSFFGQWLIAIDMALAALVELAIVGAPTAPATVALVDVARRGLRPHVVVAVSLDPAASAVPLLHGRFALNDRPTAFVCRDFACRQPVNEPEALAALLLE